ncbi:methyltransferase domain-containing protein [Dokdonia sinensis]|uniref:Methyltransferase domain-containing protein n=1 Tax=Dokdonia sinensis TaxID=2479847 RepID=A0A3M0FYX8_9FLAO|nr:methyltransferase domain-containing protein [Dokdonia sinensis]RMB57087.1 methyltransferase domain-containing protein [Dokdonia sinensis]
MSTVTIPSKIQITQTENASPERIQHFYDEATEDYTFWSKDFNMHFGYHIWGKTNPFKRDSMLNEMNGQIFNRLQLPKNQALVADLGCGMGGTMRHFLKQKINLNIIGVTLSDFQAREGNKMLSGTNGIILKEDFTKTTLPSNQMDGCVAIESFCHTGHSYKTLQETFRLLKPGKRLVIADALLKTQPEELCPGSSYSYKGLCKGWSLDGLGVIDQVEKNLLDIGFSKVTIEDVSMHVAPSVLHVPFAIPAFILKQLFTYKRIKPQSWNNLKASFYALVSGLHRKDFGYYIITATK